MELFEGFRQAIEDMFNKGQKLTNKHRDIRKRLEDGLPSFMKQLNRIQRQFPVEKPPQTSSSSSGAVADSKKRKFENQRAATQPLSADSSVSKRFKASTQPPPSRSMSTQPAALLRGRSLSMIERLQIRSIKKEPGS
jgi:hypothetical protein